MCGTEPLPTPIKDQQALKLHYNSSAPILQTDFTGHAKNGRMTRQAAKNSGRDPYRQAVWHGQAQSAELGRGV